MRNCELAVSRVAPGLPVSFGSDSLKRKRVAFALAFNGPVPQGTVEFHEAFKADGPVTEADR